MFGEAMIKRIIVAGSRNYHNYQEAESYITFAYAELEKSIIWFSFPADVAVPMRGRGTPLVTDMLLSVILQSGGFTAKPPVNKEPNNDNVRRLCYLFLGLPKPRDCLFNRIC